MLSAMRARADLLPHLRKRTGYCRRSTGKNLRSGKRFDGKTSIQKHVDRLYTEMEKDGFSVLFGNDGKDLPGNLAMPRRIEIFSCINRYRGLNL